MKKLILPLLLLTLYSCTKSPAEFDPNRAYTIKYQADDQIVKTRVINDTLRLDFYQKLNFLVDPDEFGNSWALHLEQHFTNSYLKDLHWDMVASPAGRAHDWVPINLNDVHPAQKTISNVTVDGRKYVQVSLNRVFEFYNVLASNQAAISQQNTLLQTTNHFVIYKSYYSFNSQYSLSNDQNFKLVYTQ